MKFVTGSEWVSNSRRRRHHVIKMYHVSGTLSNAATSLEYSARVFHNIIMQASYPTLWISITNLCLGEQLRYSLQKLVGIIHLALNNIIKRHSRYRNAAAYYYFWLYHLEKKITSEETSSAAITA